jgi:hypothetical protein
MASVGQKSRKSGTESQIKSLWRMVATSANDRLMTLYVSVDSLTSGTRLSAGSPDLLRFAVTVLFSATPRTAARPCSAYLRKHAHAALPPHSRNAILTLFIVQGKKPIECGDDDFLIGDPPARSP